tara:strand:- start:1058 stop:1318 length:261 start_codon:yes stop_codon:yes gene_type:complete
MGAEIGATTSVFPYNRRMKVLQNFQKFLYTSDINWDLLFRRHLRITVTYSFEPQSYLDATGRSDISDSADKNADLLTPDEVYEILF